MTAKAFLVVLCLGIVLAILVFNGYISFQLPIEVKTK